MTEPHKTTLEQELKEDLDQLEQNISLELSRRLYQARRAAIVQAATPAPRSNYFKPALTVSFASLFAFVVIFTSMKPTPVDDIINNGAKDTELISSQDNLELYQELEFYSWLALAEHG